MSDCPCGSGLPYEACCGPVHAGAVPAASPEALMRSRYSAYVRGDIDYLHDTLHPDSRADHDREAARRWASQSEWLGLDIRGTEPGSGDDEGFVEFVAKFRERGVLRQHHERSRFARLGGRWYYVDGAPPKTATLRHEGPRVGRNDPCPCGSGKKYKKCCGASSAANR